MSSETAPATPMRRPGPATATLPETGPGVTSGGSVDRARQRSDIQGLRAIAVLAVVAVHVGISNVTGGFVGVDVFFAISGFLITQQLLREVERDGRLSLLGFYARRARRILPAATLVLLVTCLYSAWQLGFVRTRTVVTDAIWSAGFAANIRFSRLQTDYFAADLPPSPLQHFWSLSVEEQFYLVWPVVVLLCALLVRRARARARRRNGAEVQRRPAEARRWLTVSVAVLTVASLLWSAQMTSGNPEAAYFSPFTRAWELGLGALAALAIRDDAVQDATARWRAQALSLAGVFLIVCACLQFNDATPFPGTPALVPVLGSVFILVAGSLWHGPTIVNRLLSVRPLRVLGDWSYSLYLWHFPLLVLPQIQAGHDLAWWQKALLLVAAVGLSAASYRYLEQPFRRIGRRRLRRLPVLLYPATLGLVLGGGWTANHWSTWLADDGYHPAITLTDQSATDPSPSASPSSSPGASSTPTTPPAEPDHTLDLLRASVVAAEKDRPIPSTLHPRLEDLASDKEDVGSCDYLAGSRKLCLRGDPDGTRTMVLIGDSHARHWIPAFDRIAERAHYKAYYLVMPQCVASLVTPDVVHSTEPFTACPAFHSWAIAQIKRLHPDLLVVSSRPVTGGIHTSTGRHTDSSTVAKAAYAGYVGLLDDVKSSAGRTVWIRDIPAITEDPGTCLSTHHDLGSCLFQPDATQQAGADLQMKAAHARGVRTVDMDDWFCWKGECPSVVGSDVTHRDTQHMTTAYSATLAQPLGTKLGLW
ncbi:acyltransferase family protein [Nocardioides sp. KR10-350]|uniref:acyltransferase family protein n=1 Tax=Nocardioides cheoyonin TaxID=3156615 RepID=UPI0032B56BE9